MFDADIIPDKPPVIGPTQERRTSRIRVPGRFIELIFKIHLNADIDLFQMRHANDHRGFVFGSVIDRHGQEEKKTDDADDDQKLDEREGSLADPRFHRSWTKVM